MKREPCIQFPQREKLLIIRESYLSICDNDTCAAALLSVFQYWHEIKLANSEQACHYNQAAQREGIQSFQDEELWVYKSHAELSRDLFDLYSEKPIGAAVKLLLAKGYISVRQNPKFKWDKKPQYHFNIEVVQSDIFALIDTPQNYGVDNVKIQKQLRKITAAIPETTITENKDSFPNGKTQPVKGGKKKDTYLERANSGKSSKSDLVVRQMAISLFKASDNPISIDTKEGRCRPLLFGCDTKGGHWIGLFNYENQHCSDSSQIYQHLCDLIPGYVTYCLSNCDEIVVSEKIFGDWWDRYRQSDVKPSGPVFIDDPERPGVKIRVG
jgi:hypothetical protein